MSRMTLGIAIAALTAMLTLTACGETTVRTVTKTVSAGSAADPASAPDASEPATDTEDASDGGSEGTAAAGGRAGEWVTVDDISFRLDSFESVSEIPTNEFSDGPIVPARGAKLYKAVVTWKNGGGSSADIFCGGGSAKLIDESDRNFDVDSQALVEIESNNVCGDSIQPGFKDTVTLVFHAPSRAVPNSIALWNGDATFDPVGEGRYVLVGPLQG